MRVGSIFQKRRGIVLSELIIVMAAIIALGAGAAVGGNTILQNGRYNTAKTDVATLETALVQYRLEIGSYPAALSALANKNGQFGPWIDSSTLTDPWGKAYKYSLVGDNISVWSTGPSGTGKISND